MAVAPIMCLALSSIICCELLQGSVKQFKAASLLPSTPSAPSESAAAVIAG